MSRCVRCTKKGLLHPIMGAGILTYLKKLSSFSLSTMPEYSEGERRINDRFRLMNLYVVFAVLNG